MLEIVGWLGSFLFAFCGVPQAWHSWKNKNSDGLSWSFLLMWFFGEVFTIIYVFPKSDVLPLLANYTFNLMLLLVIIYYRIWPKRS